MNKLSEKNDDFLFDENKNKVKTDNNFLLEKCNFILNEQVKEDFSKCYDNIVRFFNIFLKLYIFSFLI
jgi:hypothetical protein